MHAGLDNSAINGAARVMATGRGGAALSAESHRRLSLHRRKVWWYYLVFIIISSACMSALAPESMGGASYALGILLWALCWYPTARYFARDSKHLPAFELVCLAYAMQFAFPAFTAEPVLRIALGEININEADKVAAQLLSLVGVSTMQLGYYSLLRWRARLLIPALKLPLNPQRGLLYAILMSAAGLVLLYAPLFNFYSWSEVSTWQALISLIRNQSNVAIAILVWLVYVKHYGQVVKLLLYALVGASASAGLIQGGLELMLIPIAVLVGAKWLYIREIPWRLCAVSILVFVFLQPAKADFRETVWYGRGEDLTSVEKGALWVELAGQYWGDSLNGTSRTYNTAMSSAFQRMDFIHLFAHAYSMTPHVVPYQWGRTYDYLLVTFIPRAVWPDKPVASQANDFFALSYGIITDEQVGQTMFGISILIESFINFGYFGVVGVMFLQGSLFAVLDRLLNSPEAGAGGRAIYLSMIVYFLNGIGSNTANLVGGLIQIIAANFVLLLWARESIKIPRPVTKYNHERPASHRR